MSADVWLFCTDRVFPFFILFSGGKRCKFLGDFGMVRLATGDWGMGTGWVEDHYAGAVVVGRLTKNTQQDAPSGIWIDTLAPTTGQPIT